MQCELTGVVSDRPRCTHVVKRFVNGCCSKSSAVGDVDRKANVARGVKRETHQRRGVAVVCRQHAHCAQSRNVVCDRG